MIGVRIPAGAGNFYLRHYVQTSTVAHLASHPMGTSGSFPGGKAAKVWKLPLTPPIAEIKERVELYPHSSNISSSRGA
jgi:hypothetical protein